MGWQPIETAPKDGTHVLVLDPGSPPRVAAWMTALEDGAGDWVYARRLSFDDPSKALAFVVNHPTHWMPLPALPAAS